MKEFQLKTDLLYFEYFSEFMESHRFEDTDLVITNQWLFNAFITNRHHGRTVIYEEYFQGEPQSAGFYRLAGDLKPLSRYQRVIGIGGGSIMDVAKLLAVDLSADVVLLFEKKKPVQRDKKLILIPTTCGTGSEVTNISIMDFSELKTKIGLVDDELYADKAVLITELLTSLPYAHFAYSAIDALVHAIESYLSPNASAFSMVFSAYSIMTIIHEFDEISRNKLAISNDNYRQLLTASTFAGIAFNHAGTGAVHAMSYPLSGKYHVAHGEANYTVLMAVLNYYHDHDPGHDMADLQAIISMELNCNPQDALSMLDNLLNLIVKRKKLSEYGVGPEDLDGFIDIVVNKQQRLTKNNHIPLNEDDYQKIYLNCL